MASTSIMASISDVRQFHFDADTVGWEDYKQRTNRVEALSAYLSSQNAAKLINFSTIKRVLSIGTGEGFIDDYILTKCRNVKEFVGLEPDTDRCDEARTRLSTNHPHVKVELSETSFENYKAGERGFDAVLFVHSLYFFINDMKTTVEKASSMVREGGQVIIIIEDAQMIAEAEEIACGGKPGATFIETIALLKTIIKDMDTEFNIIEEDMKHPIVLDLAHQGTGCFDFLQLMVRRGMTVAEKKKVVDLLKGITRPGTSLLDIHQFIYVFTKK